MSRALTIGQLSMKTHCKVPTIRYYEEIGMMPEPSRTAGNQRRYDPEDVERLDFIQHCRELGFPQKRIRDLLDMARNPSQSCEAVNEITRNHLDDVNKRVARLLALKSELERMIEVCSGGNIADCRIIETLADHSHSHCQINDH